MKTSTGSFHNWLMEYILNHNTFTGENMENNLYIRVYSSKIINNLEYSFPTQMFENWFD